MNSLKNEITAHFTIDCFSKYASHRTWFDVVYPRHVSAWFVWPSRNGVSCANGSSWHRIRCLSGNISRFRSDSSANLEDRLTCIDEFGEHGDDWAERSHYATWEQFEHGLCWRIPLRVWKPIKDPSHVRYRLCKLLGSICWGRWQHADIQIKLT